MSSRTWSESGMLRAHGGFTLLETLVALDRVTKQQPLLEDRFNL